MKVALIVAMDHDRGIGKNNDLMWRLPNDMRFFKNITKEQIVIMGRKNYDSIPDKYRPLEDRLNVILTRNKSFSAENCEIFHSLEEALERFKNETDRTVFIIGGGQIYQQAMSGDIIDEMYITHINHSYGADTFFPKFNLMEWRVETLFEQEINEKHSESFTAMKYVKVR